MKLTSCYPL